MKITGYNVTVVRDILSGTKGNTVLVSKLDPDVQYQLRIDLINRGSVILNRVTTRNFCELVTRYDGVRRFCVKKVRVVHDGIEKSIGI